MASIHHSIPTSVNSDYNNDSHDFSEVERQIRNIAEAGFSHVQWIHGWVGEYLYSPSEMFQIRDLLRHYGLHAHTLHAPEGGPGSRASLPHPELVAGRTMPQVRKYYSSLNEYTRLAGVDLLKNRIDLCSLIGARAMVLHMQLPHLSFAEQPGYKEAYYRQVCKSFDELEGYAKAAGVRIALENLFYVAQEEENEKFERMFDRYDEDYMGMCFDSGHAALLYLDNYYHLLEKHHARLLVTHLQDNDSIDPALLQDIMAVVAHDKHRIPFTGVLDWDKIAYWVARAPLALPADFEVMLHGETEADEKAQLAECHARAVEFHHMVEGHRLPAQPDACGPVAAG